MHGTDQSLAARAVANRTEKRMRRLLNITTSERREKLSKYDAKRKGQRAQLSNANELKNESVNWKGWGECDDRCSTIPVFDQLTAVQAGNDP